MISVIFPPRASDPSELLPWPWFRLCPYLLSPTTQASVEEPAGDTPPALHPPSTHHPPLWILWVLSAASSPPAPAPIKTTVLLLSWEPGSVGPHQALPVWARSRPRTRYCRASHHSRNRAPQRPAGGRRRRAGMGTIPI